MTDSKHTKLPWKFTRTHGCSSDTWYVITDADGYGPIVDVGGKDVSGQIAEAKHLVTDPQEIEANAAYIVQCCNAYPKLVDAIRKLKEAINYTAKGECREKYGDEHGIGEYGEYDWTHFISFVCTDAIKSAGNALRDAGEEL